jgi:hypothetical protein
MYRFSPCLTTFGLTRFPPITRFPGGALLTLKLFGPYLPRFTADFNALPARNLGTLFAGILIGSNVRGFLPILADRFDTANVPNPTNTTLFPLAIASRIPLKAASIAAFAVAFDIFAFLATAVTRSDLFIQPAPCFKHSGCFPQPSAETSGSPAQAEHRERLSPQCT